MAAGLDPLQLLALLWPQGPAARGIPPPATPEAWEALDRMAGQHRLRPLLHERARTHAALAQAPDALRQRCARAHGRAGLASLRQRAALQRITQLLAEAGIGSTALKGATFAWAGWFDPALRPLRDLDLLVTPEQAAQAYRLLLDHGFDGPAPDHFAIDTLQGKHLPGLTARDSGLLVELHVAVMDHFSPAARARAEAFRHAALARALPLPGAGHHGARIRALSPTDTLLHLLVHAVLDHQFNNGPLLIHDIAALVRHGAIDWGVFWPAARALRAGQACRLGLRVAQSWEPGLAINWDGTAPDDVTPDLLRGASAMMLVDMRHQRELNWAGALAQGTGTERRARLGAMLGRGWRRAVAKPAAPDTPGKAAGAPLKARFFQQCATLGRALTLLVGRASSTAGRQHISHGLKVARWLAREEGPR